MSNRYAVQPTEIVILSRRDPWRFEFLYLARPAFTRWAKLCRASGDGRPGRGWRSDSRWSL